MSDAHLGGVGDSNNSSHTNSLDTDRPERAVSGAASLGAPIGSTYRTTQVGASAPSVPSLAAVSSVARSALSAMFDRTGSRGSEGRPRSSLEAGRASIERRSASPGADEDHRVIIEGVPNPQLGLNTDSQRVPIREGAGGIQRLISDGNKASRHTIEDSRARGAQAPAEDQQQGLRSQASATNPIAFGADGEIAAQEGWTSDESGSIGAARASAAAPTPNCPSARRATRAAGDAACKQGLFNLPPLADTRRRPKAVQPGETAATSAGKVKEELHTLVDQLARARSQLPPSLQAHSRRKLPRSRQ